jgi:hypothetical protein
LRASAAARDQSVIYKLKITMSSHHPGRVTVVFKFVWATVAVVTVAIAPAALVHGGCSSSASGTCTVGSEGCSCTAGGGCDPGLDCLSAHCVLVPGSGNAGNAGGGTSGAAGSTGSAGATGTAGTTGVAGTTGSGAVGGQSGAGGGSACAPPPPTPGCSHPHESAKTVETADPGGQSLDSFPVRFANGRLVSLDGMCCTPDTSGAKVSLDSATYPACIEGYVCGGCLVFTQDTDLQSATNEWKLLGAKAANGMAGCPAYSGAYRICKANCTGKTCGDDGCGGTCGMCPSTLICSGGSCVADPCSECLDACQGLPSCCTGVGCICDSAC